MNNEAKGELTIHVLAIPKDTKPLEDIFGG